MKDPNVNTTYTGLLHKYQPSAEHHPCYSGLQVQGAATTPAARYFNYTCYICLLSRCEALPNFTSQLLFVESLDFLLPSHCFNVQFRVPTSRDWTSTRLTTALTSNFACRLPGIGLPHGLPLLQHPIRHALALFLDFLCDSLCSNVQFRVPTSRDWTSTQLTIGSYSDISYLGSSTITAS